MKSKKGALELSMNTIVIIVIGITLLILGLAFVTGLFEKLTKQQDIIFGPLESKLVGVASHDEKLSVQTHVSVKQGEQTLFKIWIVNFDDNPKTFKLKITPSSDEEFQNNDLIVKLQRKTQTR